MDLGGRVKRRRRVSESREDGGGRKAFYTESGGGRIRKGIVKKCPQAIGNRRAVFVKVWSLPESSVSQSERRKLGLSWSVLFKIHWSKEPFQWLVPCILGIHPSSTSRPPKPEPWNYFSDFHFSRLGTAVTSPVGLFRVPRTQAMVTSGETTVS